MTIFFKTPITIAFLIGLMCFIVFNGSHLTWAQTDSSPVKALPSETSSAGLNTSMAQFKQFTSLSVQSLPPVIRNALHKYSYGPSPDNDLYLIHPLPILDNHRLVILVHGGSFLYGSALDVSMISLIQYFYRHGYTIASIDYRTLLESQWPEPVTDIAAGIQKAKQLAGLDIQKTTLLGFSAGAVASAMLLYSDQVEPVTGINNFIGFSGLYSKEALTDAPVDAIYQKTSGKVDIRAITHDFSKPTTQTPALLVEGAGDTFADKYPDTSRSHAETLAALLKQNQVSTRVVWITNPNWNGHFGPIIAIIKQNPALDTAIESFIDAH